MTCLRHTYLLFSAALALSAATSCVYDGLPRCPDGDVEITIANDWKQAPDAGPDGMAYLFFRQGVSSPWRFDFPGRDAGTVLLGQGEYAFVMYNDDTSGVLFTEGADGMPFATTARDTAAPGADSVEVYAAPDMMWGCSIDKVRVSYDGVDYTSGDSLAGGTGSFIVRTEPRQLTPRYTVRVLHVSNLQGVSAMKGVISGMAYGISLYGMKMSDKAVEVSFSPAMAADSAVCASFCTFGSLSAGGIVKNELRLYFLLSDRRLVCQVIDVTEEVLTAPDPMNVEIVIDSISLPYAPPPIDSSGGFDPTVVDWQTVIVNYGT